MDPIVQFIYSRLTPSIHHKSPWFFFSRGMIQVGIDTRREIKIKIKVKKVKREEKRKIKEEGKEEGNKDKNEEKEKKKNLAVSLSPG
ncbi:hypothetical protein P168DRAFT_156003 [Aspergillus campestris IBT 28561]|uniref:Uncharacterized protein n=1 Tax=Aspergillus campestris (strain IBT 28561) TaxID=1392248 RepID=A0A2I1D371_ASPC2|nr:uncharacterized protein P168DRAFT_156003 [Aspergillus campestris IBT 28561]PKY04319.1 hypothetical protein P168DRAFT_156003 [Aspergillus campestris IBT 28561]